MTVALWLLLPPAPVQVNVNVVDADRAPLDCEPLVALTPLQPPEAVQEVALVVLHARVAAAPLDTMAGVLVEHE